MRPKKYTLIIAVIILCVVSACDVLNQNPLSDITSANFWKTPADAENGLIAVYNQFQASTYNSFRLGEVRSDNLETPPKWGFEMVDPDNQNFNNNIIDATSGFCDWTPYYNVVTRANEVIYYSKTISFPTSSDQDRILGEALTLRAMAYFTLVKNWGAVPLFTEPFLKQSEAMYMERTEPQKVYEQIVVDLNQAEQLLPVTRSDLRLRITKATAQAVLCDVLLTRSYTSFANSSDATTVIAKADAIIGNSSYSLLNGSQYSNLFRTKKTNESIFEVWFDYTQGSTQSFCNYFLPRAYNKSRPYGGETIMLPSRALDAEFKKEPGDLRYASTITVLSKDEEKYYDTNVVGMTYGNKYLGTVASIGVQRYSDNNIIIYRLADVKLMKAEALIKTNDVPSAMTIVNEIRNRAGLDAISASSQNDALDKLLNERRKEFAFEGKRWYDLLRTNKILEFKTEPTFVKNRTLLAVPQFEIDKNPKLTQNSTY